MLGAVADREFRRPACCTQIANANSVQMIKGFRTSAEGVVVVECPSADACMPGTASSPIGPARCVNNQFEQGFMKHNSAMENRGAVLGVPARQDYLWAVRRLLEHVTCS